MAVIDNMLAWGVFATGHWTTEAPTKLGAYVVIGSSHWSNVRILFVTEWDDGQRFYQLSDMGNPFKEWPGNIRYWSAPLPPLPTPEQEPA